MANLSPAEKKMFLLYNGDDHLEDNDSFWVNVLANYKEKVVVLPMPDNYITRRFLSGMLLCNPGECNECCHYNRVPLNSFDLARFEIAKIDANLMYDEGKHYLVTEGGCQFLKDGACSIYKNRPDVCKQFPIQASAKADYDGQPLDIISYRIKCYPSVLVVREILTEACRGGMLLLPDLSLVKRDENK